ncbi:cytochrome P450, partial [Suillus spraguei]
VQQEEPAYPPGPPGWPLIGNILDMPHIKPWLIFTEWGKKYGHISHIEVFGQHIVILNSRYLLDRPILPVGGELIGWKNVMTLLPYGTITRHRKNFHTMSLVLAPLWAIQSGRGGRDSPILKRVFAKPINYKHIRHTAGAVILRISHDALDQWSPIAFGRFTLNGPFLVVKVPEWFPGAGFKRLAREWHDTLEEMVSAPYKFVLDQMAAGIAPESFTSKLVGRMTLFPDVQKKAQAEIDAVIGPDRLPSFADQALAKEALRWHAVIPTGFPHCASEDDIHDGYYIPKGSVVLPNIWFMLNDPERYANPSEFNPERFLGNDGKKPETEPRTICFGFGRRYVTYLITSGTDRYPYSHPKPFKCRPLIEQDANY